MEFLENVLLPFLLNLKLIATEREGEALCERLTDMLGGRSQESIRAAGQVKTTQLGLGLELV